MIRIPKPSYLRSQLLHQKRPDAAMYRVLTYLAEMYHLGYIKRCHRIPCTLRPNFIVTTSRGKYIFRRQHLSETDIAYEHQVLDHLQQRAFPAPRILLNKADLAWSAIDGALYSVYEFIDGYCPENFLWWPAAKREIITQCGRTLGEYHQAVADLVPSFYKWNGYCPAEHKRWSEGNWFRQILADIRPLLQKPTATSPMDHFTRARIDAIERMLELEPVVESCLDLSKVVIHGDFAPWNILFRRGQPPVVLDFNESRLDLKIYDVTLATFWFAWRDNRLDQDRALAFQTGYCQTGQLSDVDISLASSAFQWIMARSLTERLYIHYLQQRPLNSSPAGMEKQYRMCIFARQQPQQLVAGLKEKV